MNKSIIWSLVLLIIIAALYRIIPNRPFGFAPHIAMALFAGSVIKDRKWALALPVFSIFLSDLMYQLLYINGASQLSGFYEGQVTNYTLFIGITAIGFLMKKVNIKNIFLYSLFTPTVYFIASNFLVWFSGAGYSRPKTFSGLMQCYADALPFYRNSIIATLSFSILLFGGYLLLNRSTLQTKSA